MENIRNRECVLSLNHKAIREPPIKSIKLGSSNRSRRSSLSTKSKATLANTESILSSLSRKLHPDTIETFSRNRSRNNYEYSIKDSIASSYIDQTEVKVSCMPDFDTVSLMSFISEGRNEVTFKDLLKKIKHSGKPSLIQDVHEQKKDRKGCFSSECSIKEKWIKNIVFYEREIKNLILLKDKVPFLNSKITEQIGKDVHRSFPEGMFPKTKITVYQASSEKSNMLANLKLVLMLYAAYDETIGYVQGMNLVVASIITHMKDVDSSFILLKELMNYGKLRTFFINDFEYLKRESTRFFECYLKLTAYELYEHFVHLSLFIERLGRLAINADSYILLMLVRLYR